MAAERNPVEEERRQILMIQGRRASLISTITFFIGGLAVLLSLNLTGASPGLQPGGVFVLVGGIALAVAVNVGLRRAIPRSRPCTFCRHDVLLGSSKCPSCGQPVPKRRGRGRTETGVLPPRDGR